MSEYFDLGNYSRPISTNSPEAQLWFDRGLVWTYGFNHEEAIRCFKRVVKIDPQCGVGYWGIAYAKGPFYNKPWAFYGRSELPTAVQACYEYVQTAFAHSQHSSPVEQALIKALTHRYPKPAVVTQAEFDQWDADYADAMAKVYAQFPDDLDVIALYAEAMMTKTPWKLWNLQTGLPEEGADTETAVAALEEGLHKIDQANLPPHPGIVHLVIHAMEMSPTPEKALRAADSLRDLVPDSGHLCHMPSHIDVLCGHYFNAVVASEKAVAADAKYLPTVGKFGFYTTACCHDFHLMMYAAMMMADSKTAARAARGITELVTAELLQVDIPHLVSTLDGYHSMHMHVPVRFGKWQEIIDMPHDLEPDLYLVSTASRYYAKGVAFAALGQHEMAEHQVELFEAAVSRIPETRRFFNNKALDVLAIGREMMRGEMMYHRGNHNEAFAHLRPAVWLNDNLFYTEPWAWMHPPRHALGALLLEHGHVEE
ncbi:MAG: tetratricopeptide repeat protein, partial [Chloroflexota bacterium]